MKFEEVLPALREGKKIRRKAYPPDYYICLEDKVLKAFISYYNRLTGGIKLISRDLLADDWEIIEEKKKKVKLRDLTEEQYENWKGGHCNSGDFNCNICPFVKVVCTGQKRFIDVWIRNKDLYSDKFLDQEIEIEEE